MSGLIVEIIAGRSGSGKTSKLLKSISHEPPNEEETLGVYIFESRPEKFLGNLINMYPESPRPVFFKGVSDRGDISFILGMMRATGITKVFMDGNFVSSEIEEIVKLVEQLMPSVTRLVLTQRRM